MVKHIHHMRLAPPPLNGQSNSSGSTYHAATNQCLPPMACEDVLMASVADSVLTTMMCTFPRSRGSTSVLAK